MQKLRRRFGRASAPGPSGQARAGPGTWAACFARASSPPPVTTRRAFPPPPPPQPEPASPFAAALERLSAALGPGSAQLGEIEFEGDDGQGGGGDDAPASVAAPPPRPPRPSAPGSPSTPAPGDAPGEEASGGDRRRQRSTPPPAKGSPAATASVSPRAHRQVPTPMAGGLVEEGVEEAVAVATPAPTDASLPPPPRPPVFEVEEAPLPAETPHPRTDALPVAPITIEVLARMLAGVVAAGYGAALAALGARTVGEAAAALARAARGALSSRAAPAAAVLHAYAPGLAARGASAWASARAAADRVWEATVRWWAVAVEQHHDSDGPASDESTAGSAPRASVGGEAEDWEAVPPESAVGWVARE